MVTAFVKPGCTEAALKVTVIVPLPPFSTGEVVYFGTVHPQVDSIFEIISGSSRNHEFLFQT
jgi:hypothetical protein